MPTAYIKLGAGIVAAVVVAWLGLPRLAPLAKLIPNTKSMVTTTREILTETRELKNGVSRVQTNLAKLEQQDRLLAEQEQLTAQVLTELKQQEELAGDATVLLTSLLERERTTAELTARANHAAGEAMDTVTANAGQLSRLAGAAGRIKTNSAEIDTKVDRLLVAMQGSAENFAVVARLKAAPGKVIERTERWWERWWPFD